MTQALRRDGSRLYFASTSLFGILFGFVRLPKTLLEAVSDNCQKHLARKVGISYRNIEAEREVFVTFCFELKGWPMAGLKVSF